MRGLCWLAGVLWLGGAACAAFAASAPPLAEVLHFRQVDERNGLSQSTARALAQDHLGFVWIGTQDGLNRFDGARAEVYRRGDGSGLSDNHILALLAVGEQLFVGTQAGGLQRLDPRSGRFESPGGELLAAAPMVPALAASGDTLFAALNGIGLARVALPGGEVSLASETAALRGIRALHWRAGTLAIGARDGLWLWPDGAAAPQPVDLGAAAATPAVAALAFAADGRRWVGLEAGGLWLLETADETPRLRPSGVEVISPQIRSVLVDRRNRVWVGTEAGLTRHDPASGQSLHARHDPGSETSLPANRLPALLEDGEGLVWAGSWTAGVGIYRPDSEVVTLYRHFAGVPQSLPANPVRALLPQPDGSLWLGVLEQGGLVHFDPARGVLGRWRHDPADAASLPDDRVEALLRRQDGSLWVGTANGIARLREDGRFERFRHDPEDPDSLPGNGVVSLYEDPERTLWVGLVDLGLARRCRDCEGFSGLPLAPDSPVRQVLGRINQVLRTRDGYYWFAGMPNGLYRYDPLRQQLQRYSHDPDDPDSLSHDSVLVLLEDRRGRLWLGTQGGGLVEVLRDGQGQPQRFRAIRRADGLSGDAVGGVLEAPDGAIWAATISGLSRLDPESGELRNLDASFGELARGYFIGAAAVGADGIYYFGGLRGLTALQPGRLPPARGLPALRLTGVALDNTPIERIEGRPLIDQPVVQAARIVVPPQYGVVGIEFAALDFLAPESLRYAYRLPAIDATWINTPASRRYAAFTRLPPGRYALELRVGRLGQDERGDQVVTAVELLVEAPWWRTTAAVLAYVAGALVLLALSWRRWRARHARELAAQAAVRDSEERLKLALWGSGDELWDLDLVNGRMHRENALPGLQAPLAPRGIEDYLEAVHPDDRSSARQAFLDHLAGRSDHYDVTFRRAADDGRWRWVLARGRAVLRAANGRAERVAGTVRDISESKANEEALKRLADELESRVEARTADHRQAIAQLKRTVEELTLTQKQLVESEKMASLGQLVAGVAHEINTPIGIGVTAASHLKHEAEQLQAAVAAGRLSRSDLQEFTQMAATSAQLVLSNLGRASELVRSFKQVAVDQSSEQRRSFLLREYLDEILLSLRPRLKATRHRVRVDCDPALRLNTYPGALYQILVNLVMNSLLHGFEGITEGEISISARADGDALLLSYRDNGRGMNAQVRQRVFDPFFTTRRKQGGSGLGMHLVFNLVTQMLRGSIELHSEPDAGVCFEIAMPGAVEEVD